MMFSINESWFQEGESALHDALFGATEVQCVATSSNSKENLKKMKKKKRKKAAETCKDSVHRDEHDEDDSKDIEIVRLDADEEKGGASVKPRKRKKKRTKHEDKQSPSERKRTRSELSSKLAPTDSTSVCTTNDYQSSTNNGVELLESVEKYRGEAKRTALKSKMASKMEGARFRWINEQLYTTTGHRAKQLFDEDPSLFEIYHSGFATQVSKWPLNPLDKVIDYVQSLPSDFIIADFGCGEARLAHSVPHTVHSFDLIATNSSVIACDMAHVPLPKRSVDVVVFCLSLMGSNVCDFIREAKRVLKKGGVLKICEIASRMESVEEFIANVELFGFKLVKRQAITKMFLDFEFRVKSNKGDTSTSVSGTPSIHLNPCIYKRR